MKTTLTIQLNNTIIVMTILIQCKQSIWHLRVAKPVKKHDSKVAL